MFISSMRSSHLVRRTIFIPPHELSSMTRKTDPLVHSSIREAILVTGIWLRCRCNLVHICLLHDGIPPCRRRPEDLSLASRTGSFRGIVIPWATSAVVSIVFGLIFVPATEISAKISKTPMTLDWEAEHDEYSDSVYERINSTSRCRRGCSAKCRLAR